MKYRFKEIPRDFDFLDKKTKKNDGDNNFVYNVQGNASRQNPLEQVRMDGFMNNLGNEVVRHTNEMQDESHHSKRPY